MRPVLLSVIIIFCQTLLLLGQTPAHHAQANINCKECHSCDIPTHSNPCLKLFPDFRREGITIHDNAEDAPELFTIDILSGEYEASIFTHKLHAEMSAMSGGCASCHHFNPPGKILSCINCHEAGLQSDMNKPGLKGAYHRQCLNCHREWSHTTNCTVCHAAKGTKNAANKSEFVGKSHEKLVVPIKLVYETGEDDNPVVTFFHDEHNTLFGIDCAECHKNESCSRCHDTSEDKPVVEKDTHDNCVACHESAIDDDSKCSKCHDTKEKARFSHTAVGWKLNRYHESLGCKACHTHNTFKKQSTDCLSCHNAWKSNQFDHEVSGLQLDENHIENDCSDCHTDMKFNRKPFCNDCHDGYKYPAQKPGRKIKY